MDPYIRIMFGENSRHFPVQLILQRMTSQNGAEIAGLVGVAPDAMGSTALGAGFTHELIVGDVVLRPHRIFGDNAHLGQGFTGLATSGALFPHNWQFELVNGVYVPNPDYSP